MQNCIIFQIPFFDFFFLRFGENLNPDLLPFVIYLKSIYTEETFHVKKNENSLTRICNI